MKSTTATINFDQFLLRSSREAMRSFTELFSEVCNGDDRVTLFDLSPMGDRLTIEVEGTVTAQELADEVFQGKHGAW